MLEEVKLIEMRGPKKKTHESAVRMTMRRADEGGLMERQAL